MQHSGTTAQTHWVTTGSAHPGDLCSAQQSPLQAPQSAAQVEQFSLPLQLPSPQNGHAPQSAGHVAQVSPASHVPLGQTQAAQSAGQVQQSSPAPHVPSPQYGQAPQS